MHFAIIKVLNLIKVIEMKVNKLTALSLAALMSGAQAATVGGSFNVTVSLTSKCTMAADQAGDASAAVTQVRTLTITY
jgi:hypothetical protein